jgi:hypothetical protein
VILVFVFIIAHLALFAFAVHQVVLRHAISRIPVWVAVVGAVVVVASSVVVPAIVVATTIGTRWRVDVIVIAKRAIDVNVVNIAVLVVVGWQVAAAAAFVVIAVVLRWHNPEVAEVAGPKGATSRVGGG